MDQYNLGSDCEWLKLPTVQCHTTNHQHRKQQTYEHKRQDKFIEKEIKIKITYILTTNLIQKQTTLLQVQTWKQAGLQVLKQQLK